MIFSLIAAGTITAAQLFAQGVTNLLYHYKSRHLSELWKNSMKKIWLV